MLIASVITLSFMMVALSPFIGVGIGIYKQESAIDVALYGALSTTIVSLTVIFTLVYLEVNNII